MLARYIIVTICCVLSVTGRIHKLEITNDMRKFIALSTFGFYKGGILHVQLRNLTANPDSEDNLFGFSLDRTLNDAMNPYLDNHPDKCLLQEPFDLRPQHHAAVIYFTLDLKNRLVKINCTKDLQRIHIYKNPQMLPEVRRAPGYLQHMSDTLLFAKTKRQALNAKDKAGNSAATSTHDCSQVNLTIIKEIRDGKNYYSTEFVMYVASQEEEGLYNLYFHSCPNYNEGKQVAFDFTIQIEENNGGNYLSAGDMPLPALYFMMALLFFLSGCFWIFILRKSKHPVFKIHYLMAVLIYLKSLSLMFHSINYHYIETRGEHVEAWAILYYVVHLLKGAVLFVTIVLIGTGWTFIKHILADKDKKLFMFVISLQVLANVAEIIIEESEEGDKEHKTWRRVFILVDLLCCGAISFPVVWSIRHLQEATQAGGKAAINLLKLFKHFYLMIICYIYFTRMIVLLLKETVPFQYEWLDEMFREMATYVFFVLTGYKFRPASSNPYFVLNTEEEEINEVLTESGVTEGLIRLTARSVPEKTIIEATEEEKNNLLSKRESSHEYD